VYASRNGLGIGIGIGIGRGSQVGLRPHIEPGFRGMVVPHQTEDVWHDVCAACGYAETYVFGEQAMVFVRQSWARVPGAPPAAPVAAGPAVAP
jgi:hypothetical protein